MSLGYFKYVFPSVLNRLNCKSHRDRIAGKLYIHPNIKLEIKSFVMAQLIMAQ